MSLNLPLSVRLSTAKGDMHVTRDLLDLSFRTAIPGGFASATLSLSRPLALEPNEIANFGRVFVYDRRDGSVVWEGRLEDSGRSAGGSGEVWQVAATGPAAHAQDRTISLIYVDHGLDGWNVGAQSFASVNVSFSDEQGITMALASGTTFHNGSAGLAVYHQIAYTSQMLGRVQLDWTAGVASSNIEARLGTSLGTGATVDQDVQAAALSGTLTAARGDTPAISSGHDTVRLRFARIASDLSVTNDTVWINFVPVVRGLLKDVNGNDITSGYGFNNVEPVEVITDLLGRLLPRYDGPNAVIEISGFTIDQLAYPDGASPQKVLEDLMTIEPAYYWAAWESNAAGLHRFEWVSWPTTVRYEASAADGFDSPASAGEIYNAVSVRWRDGLGVGRTTRSTQTVKVLDDAGVPREAYFDLADEVGSAALATKAGEEFLAEHQVATNQGTLTISRPILDIEKGRYVMPWEIRPGSLIRVRDVLPRIDSLNVNGRDGVTIFKIAAVEFSASTATASLELDSYPLTVSRAISNLSKRRIYRKR